MPDAAFDSPVRIFAREFFCIGTRLRMRRSVSVAFERDGRHGDAGDSRKPLFQIVILRLALSQSEPPTIIMDHDADVIWIVEGRCATIERRISQSSTLAKRAAR